MDASAPRITYVGGPTALLEWRGLRLLTDPTFDPAGTRYELPAYTLRKTQDPAVEPTAVGRLDAVLLSHDHHGDTWTTPEEPCCRWSSAWSSLRSDRLHRDPPGSKVHPA